jgi:hypothetical protein
MGRTITLEIPDETFETIETQAQVRGLKPEQVVIEWLSEATKRVKPGKDPLEALIGSLESTSTDIADNHDQYVGRTLEQELRRG